MNSKKRDMKVQYDLLLIDEDIKKIHKTVIYQLALVL